MSKARLLSAALFCALLSLPAVAEDEPKLEVKRETLKVPKAKQLPPSRKEMLDQTRKVTRAYYDALKNRRYDEAAALLHPSTIEPLREAMLKKLDEAPPPEKKAMLTAFGVKEESRLKTMPLKEFYTTWAKSPYGKGVQILSQIDLQVVLGPPSCRPADRICEVHVKLNGVDPKGEKMKAPSDVWVIEDGGRWFLTVNPPEAT